jgi:hypothetical protein
VRAGKLVPALFCGAPISFIVAGGLVLAGLGGGLALAIGFAIGTSAAGRLLKKI